MLTDRGVTQFEFFLSHLPEEVEAFLGNGERWGCNFRYHIVSDERLFYQSLSRLELLPEENLIIGHTDSLPVDGTITAIRQLSEKPAIIVTATDQDAEKDCHWTGWAGVHSALLPRLFECRDRNEVMRVLCEEQAIPVEVAPDSILNLDSPNSLLDSQLRVLNRTPEDLLLGGRELETNVRFGRQTRVHRSVKFEAPAFLGENVQVGKNVVIGSNSVIGKNCVLDDGCSIANSVVMPNTYVGRDIDLRNSLACRGFLVNAQHQTALEIDDSFILGDLKRGVSGGRQNLLLSRIIAASALLLLSPVLMLTALILRITRRGPVMYRWNAVTRNANNGSRLVEFERFSFLPAKARNQDTGIKTLLLDRLPNLVNVVRGEMGFVGPKPKSLAELDSIPPSWRELYLEARPGIISEAELILGPDAEAEELYAVEAVYSVTRHGLRDFKLGIDYLRRSLLGRNLAV
jgi:lipopolysaccharide/colanic/teichoic acid biosynthesis glycosyltransferase